MKNGPLYTNKEFPGGQAQYEKFSREINNKNSIRLHAEKQDAFKSFFANNISLGRDLVEPNGKQSMDIFQGETEIPLSVFGILSDDVELTRIALETDQNRDISFGPLGESLIHLAVKSEVPLPLLNLLKEFDLNIDKQNLRGETAFFVVAGRNDVEVGQKLTEIGANISIPDFNGTSPILHAADNKADKIVIFISGEIGEVKNNKEDLQKTFRKTLEGGDVAVQQELANHFLFNKVDNKPSLESMDEVLLATWQNDTETVKKLVECGFSLETQDSTGRDPLEIAQITGNQDLEEFIDDQLNLSSRM